MKVDGVSSWGFSDIPEKYRERKAYDISMEELEELHKSYDVAIIHVRQPQPSKKQLANGAKSVPDLIMLALDTPGGWFRQR
jgi:hypothetical protein